MSGKSSRLPILAPRRTSTATTSTSSSASSATSATPKSSIITTSDIFEEPVAIDDTVGESCAQENPFVRPNVDKNQVVNRVQAFKGIPPPEESSTTSTSASATSASATSASASTSGAAVPTRPRPLTTRASSASSTSTRTPASTKVPVKTAAAAAVKEQTIDEMVGMMAEIAEIEEARLRENAWNETGHLEIGDQDWILNNSLEFPDFVNSHFSDYRLTRSYEIDCFKREEDQLFEYQKFVQAYISTISPYRGIFLYYGLGSGKTRASIEIARLFANEGNMCLFISKAKLIYNFAKELAKWQWTWGNQTFTKRNYEQFTAISTKCKSNGQSYLEGFGVGYAAYNAGAYTMSQLQRYADPKTGKLTNMVIIIDEVHNLVQQLHNGMNAGLKKTRESKERYYRMLMETENCRFVTLSGTPIVNLSSELAILFNILRGPIPIPKDFVFNPDWERHTEIKKRGYFELFPVKKDLFDQYFVDYNNRRPINIDIFQRRIQGLVSYYSGAKGKVYPQMVDEEGNPTDKPVIVRITMSEAQTIWYEFMREGERKLAKKKTIDSVEEALRAEDEEVSSNFRVKSRMASNYGFPMEILEHVPVGKREKEDIADLLEILDQDTNEYYGLNLAIYSAKMSEIIAKLDFISTDEPEKDGGVLIYSNYRSVEGIELMARALKEHGYTEYKPGDEQDPEFDFYDARRFAILGSKDGEETQKIIETYNSRRNLFLPSEDDPTVDNRGNEIPYIGAGRIVKILLGTEVISEGIDLFNIRQVHIMEPHWNFVRIDQTIGRARRVCSHMNLPEEYWTFTAWVYLSILDPTSKISSDKDSTDEIIYTIAEAKKKINDVFLWAIKSAAVDCNLNATHNTEVNASNEKIKCMILPPPTKHRIHAYNPDLALDLTAPKYEVTKVAKEKIMLGKYSQTPFSYQRFPELWKLLTTPSGQKRVDHRYLMEIDRNGEIKRIIEADTVKIFLYDREAAESVREPIQVGYLLLKEGAKPIIVRY